MADAPKKIGELYEPPKPDWWKINKAKVYLVAGVLLGAWFTNSFGDHAAPHPGPPRPSAPSQSATLTPER